jgi:hypothetical protein
MSIYDFQVKYSEKYNFAERKAAYAAIMFLRLKVFAILAFCMIVAAALVFVRLGQIWLYF